MRASLLATSVNNLDHLLWIRPKFPGLMEIVAKSHENIVLKRVVNVKGFALAFANYFRIFLIFLKN